MIDQIEVVGFQWAFRLIEVLFGNWLARRDSLAKAREEAAVAKAREEERAKCMQFFMELVIFAAAMGLLYVFLKSLQSAARA